MDRSRVEQEAFELFREMRQLTGEERKRKVRSVKNV